MSAPARFRWDDIPPEQLKPGLTRQFLTGAQAMLARIVLTQGCVVPTHSHPNEQIAYILSGHLQFTLEGHPEPIDLRTGEILVIPANLPHAAVALEDTVDLDLFAPPREDWLSGSDAYLR